jgi:hypothetical protein
MTKEELLDVLRLTDKSCQKVYIEHIWETIQRERKSLMRRYQRKIKALQNENI